MLNDILDSVDFDNRLIPWLILANSPITLGHMKGSSAWKRNEADNDINSTDGTGRKPMSFKTSTAITSAEKLDLTLNSQSSSSGK